MALSRRDDSVQDAQGRALSGAQVYYCTQPANTSTMPPSPLATVASDLSGTPTTNPQVSNGYGKVAAYLPNNVLYTVVISHPLFGASPLVLPDQSVGGGSGGVGYQPFAGVLQGTKDGNNKTFTFTNNGTALTVQPVAATVWFNFPLVNGLGYTISGPQVTFATAPGTGDTLYASGLF